MSLLTRLSSATSEIWKRDNFSIPRLSDEPSESALAEIELSPELVKALTYNLHFESCYRHLEAILQSQWLTNYLASTPLNEKVLDLCLCVAESGIEAESVREVLWTHVAGNIESEEYRHAFNRIFTLFPYNYDLETFLVECGHTEILESVDRLQSVGEIRFYVERLNKEQLERLFEETKSTHIEAVIEKTRPRSWPLSRAHTALPKDPPRFCCAESLWQWHADLLGELGSDQEYGLWNELRNRASLALPLWNEQLTSLTVLPEHTRTMLLSRNTNKSAARFYMKYDNGFKTCEEVASILTKTAGSVDPVFGKSLMAASVYYRRDAKKDELHLCQKLDPLDTLSTEECTRYLLDYGADISVLSIDRAVICSRKARPLTKSKACYMPLQDLMDPYTRTKVIILLILQKCTGFGLSEKPLSLPLVDKTAAWFVLWD